MPQAEQTAVTDAFPTSIARAWEQMCHDQQAQQLVSAFEALLHFLATVSVSAYVRQGATDPEMNAELVRLLYKPTWSTGCFLELVRECTRRLDRASTAPRPCPEWPFTRSSAGRTGSSPQPTRPSTSS